ncbi:cupin domain-containing protein [Sphingomonas sp. AR_OL41]|uniref:cupin domain-containing protein n=1 Tax=Sphingomonas sp. AR_OL41 TaxID=3042729 RepID=UPI0024817614|nr:cupin domain-containing protein [Sphingomonas sp. AR_OL41]MDH7970586.1 cupin domain-containing protein [Sphingomonas sp. AR_OL41]
MMGAPAIINLDEKFGEFSDHWNPRIVGAYNGNELRLAKLQGDFAWHSHAETDELFLVVKGAIGIEFRDGVRRLGQGEMIVVPRGIEHRPFAEEEAHVLLIDREGEPNTGVNPSHLTRAKLETL